MSDETNEVRDLLVTALHQFDLAVAAPDPVYRRRHFDAARTRARQANDEILLLDMKLAAAFPCNEGETPAENGESR